MWSNWDVSSHVKILPSAWAQSGNCKILFPPHLRHTHFWGSRPQVVHPSPSHVSLGEVVETVPRWRPGRTHIRAGQKIPMKRFLSTFTNLLKSICLYERFRFWWSSIRTRLFGCPSASLPQTWGFQGPQLQGSPIRWIAVESGFHSLSQRISKFWGFVSNRSETQCLNIVILCEKERSSSAQL